ncbi:MAG: GntR family transcriptional regulator [Proteobacteria bacterium]|nr:GntR family transcriptional regulator [Pseudomonadota bacterium]
MNQQPLFLPAQIGRASEDITLQIEAAIVGQKIKPGERLPSERKLQEQFKTGRGVIREAMRALKQKGLIEIKKGSKGGAFIKQIDMGNVSESLALFLTQNQIDSDHLIEFRESIDRTITLLAIAKAGKESKQKLLDDSRKLKWMALKSEPDFETLAEMDRQLNIDLANMTSNPLFEWIMNAIQQGFSSNDFVLYKNPEFREKTVENWYETASQIHANDPLKSLASISRHYDLLRQCIKISNGENRLVDEDFWDESHSNTE